MKPCSPPQAQVQTHPLVRACEESLSGVAANLQILNPEIGGKDGGEALIAEVALELAKLRAHIASV